MGKLIPLKPLSGMRIVAITIGLLFIVAGIASFFGEHKPSNIFLAGIIYIFIGISLSLIALQNKFIGSRKYINITDKNIEIKRWVLTKIIPIKIDDIEEVKIVGSRFSIKYANTQELINLEWISGHSRMEFANELEKLAKEKKFSFEKINILDRFKNKEL